jgi:hypothetical protein
MKVYYAAVFRAKSCETVFSETGEHLSRNPWSVEGYIDA